LRVRFKLWLEKGGEPIISEGKYRLLKEIEKSGSILGAAERLGLSYKRAHCQIKTMEERLGMKIVERRRGKGARLTKGGKDLLDYYEGVVQEFQRLAERFGKPSGG